MNSAARLTSLLTAGKLMTMRADLYLDIGVHGIWSRFSEGVAAAFRGCIFVRGVGISLVFVGTRLISAVDVNPEIPGPVEQGQHEENSAHIGSSAKLPLVYHEGTYPCFVVPGCPKPTGLPR